MAYLHMKRDERTKEWTGVVMNYGDIIFRSKIPHLAEMTLDILLHQLNIYDHKRKEKTAEHYVDFFSTG